MSSYLLMIQYGGFSGVCLEVLHWTGDQLCRDPKFGKLERPRLPPPALGAPAPAGPADVSERLAGEVQQVIFYSNVVNVPIC